MNFRQIGVGTVLLIFCGLMVVTPGSAAEKDKSSERAAIRRTHKALMESKRMAVERMRAYQKYSAAFAPEGQADYDVLWYDIKMKAVDIDESISDSLYGAVTFHAAAVVDGLTQVPVDLIDENPIDSIVSPAGTLTYTRADDVVTVFLDRTYSLGESFEFTVYYRHEINFGYLPNLPSAFNTFSEPLRAPRWWACKQRLDDKADSFKIAVTVDTSYYVGSNGTLDSIVEHGNEWHTFYYTEHYPMAMYLFSISVSDYVLWYDSWVYNGGADTLSIVNAVFPDDYDQSLEIYGVVPQALTIYSDLFGLYPFSDEKYGHTMSVGGEGIEHQTMTTLGNDSSVFNVTATIHELAHQWWGDMITCRSWQHVWLNEGFATYCEALYYEGTEGEAAYHNHMDHLKYFSTDEAVFAYDTTISFFTYTTYYKGAWVLHMLRGMVGDSLFFAGMKAYYGSEFQYRDAVTEDFRDIMEGATGWELDWFFDEWVYGYGYPVYKWSYWSEPSDSGGVIVYFALRQTQTTSPQVFTMPISVTFRQIGSDTTLTLFNDERSQMYRLHLALEEIAVVVFDPDDWILDVNSQEPWGIRIVTTQEEISPAAQYQSYVDTIESKGGYGLRTFSLVGGALPSGFTLDADGIISGMTSDTGQFTFTVHVEEQGLEDEVEFTMTVTPTPVVAGDVDYNGSVSVADVTYLVAYLFQGGTPPPISDLADVDASCSLNVADLTYLVDYLFKGGSAPLLGCVI